MTQAEWYAQKAREDAERRAAVHEASMRERQASMAKNPGMYSQWEKKAVDAYVQGREDARRFDESQRTARGQWGFTDADGTHHAGGAEAVAQYDWMGKRDAGSTAADINANATRYGADKAFEGIKAKAQSDEEIARQKAEAEKWIAGRNADATEAGSKREWGYTDEQGNYHPGGRVAQAQAQGDAAAKIAEQNNQAKIAVAQLNAEGKQKAATIAGDSRVKSALAGNVVLGNNPEKLQEMVEMMMANGLSEQQIYASLGVQIGQQPGGGKAPPQVNQRTQAIKDRAAGLGV